MHNTQSYSWTHKSTAKKRGHRLKTVALILHTNYVYTRNVIELHISFRHSEQMATLFCTLFRTLSPSIALLGTGSPLPFTK